jgi:hypothetical protein
MEKSTFAPIAIFAYKRQVHLSRTIESLKNNPEACLSFLTVFCDGAKKDDDKADVEAVRNYADQIQGFAKINIVKRQTNLGLSANIVSGVTHLTESFGRVIVVEDDLVCSPYFLRYMNDALNIYSEDDCVASIHGYIYPVKRQLPDTFFLRGADCWGWATWWRSWQHFRSDGSALLAELESRGLVYDFDMDGQYGFTRMLIDQIAGRNDSWAIRWHASCFLDGRLTLYPGRSLVHNIGNDGSGTHSKISDIYEQTLSTIPLILTRQPTIESLEGRAAIVNYFKNIRLKLPYRILRNLLRSLTSRNYTKGTN